MTSPSPSGPARYFGIAGVAGNGQNELLLALERGSPRVCPCRGTIRLDGQPLARTLGTSWSRRCLGLCAVPEERNGHGAVPDFSTCPTTPS